MAKEYVRDEYPFRNITQEEADLLCAKHVLWLHGQGGEQANFCLLYTSSECHAEKPDDEYWK